MLDVVVIGGGPAGSTTAALLAKKGHSVVLLERDQFPRFQIGESLLPFNNDLFDRLGVRTQLESGPGSAFPKHGAEFVTADGKLSYVFRFARFLAPAHARSFQVKRAEFDHLLLLNAIQAGADVREQVAVTDVDLSHSERVRIKAVGRDGSRQEFESRFVVDASGHGAMLGTRLGEKRDEDSLRKIAIFAHYRSVSDRATGLDAGNTVIVILRDAWFWLIPLTDDMTSVGLVVDRDVVVDSKTSPTQLLERMISETPYLTGRMREATRETEVYVRKDFSYRMRRVMGKNFALVGDAAGFFDPIFSTGVFVAMKTGEIVADAADARLRSGSMRALKRYQRSHTAALRRYFSFIHRFYRREFLEVFLQPAERFGLLPVIVGLLAGDVFEKKSGRWRLALFFLLTRIQKRTAVIARPIPWDTLPGARRSLVSEESFV